MDSAGDKPEDLYPEAAAELQQMGHTSTVSYVAEAARVVFQESGLLPHINAGTLQQSQLTDLRRWSASQVGRQKQSQQQPKSLLPVHAAADALPACRQCLLPGEQVIEGACASAGHHRKLVML
jgi:FO synthase